MYLYHNIILDFHLHHQSNQLAKLHFQIHLIHHTHNLQECIDHFHNQIRQRHNLNHHHLHRHLIHHHYTNHNLKDKNIQLCEPLLGCYNIDLVTYHYLAYHHPVNRNTKQNQYLHKYCQLRKSYQTYYIQVLSLTMNYQNDSRKFQRY